MREMSIREVTRENWREALCLTVSPEQQQFVAGNDIPAYCVEFLMLVTRLQYLTLLLDMPSQQGNETLAGSGAEVSAFLSNASELCLC